MTDIEWGICQSKRRQGRECWSNKEGHSCQDCRKIGHQVRTNILVKAGMWGRVIPFPSK